jgi:poly-beta-1,6-N-acetyl-D-glucosamine synthase
MVLLFWLFIAIIFYTFIGYGIILYLLVLLKRLFQKKKQPVAYDLPSVTLVVAAYNEEDIIEDKIKNTLALEYAAGKASFLFITDGSSDKTADIISKYPQIRLMHTPERRGKIAAIHRAMDTVETDAVVFTDANTFLNKEALVLLVSHYADDKVGAMAGEKRVIIGGKTDAAGSEGIYWKYESMLKKWDAELYSVVGAAGELFSIRKELYEAVPADTLLDDFMLSLNIAAKGYKTAYEPNAYAVETSSANVKEELKRKIRIGAGGIQSILRLKKLLNPFRNPVLTFQYVSHRVLRWVVTPFLLVAVLLLNVLIICFCSESGTYKLLLLGQVLFYCAAMAGWLLQRKEVRVKLLFIPYYFTMMNYAVIAGIYRYFKGQQKVTWDKAKRK